ncbi:hypothetical protein ACRAWF_44640 [Streptomyces sp. L7]
MQAAAQAYYGKDAVDLDAAHAAPTSPRCCNAAGEYDVVGATRRTRPPRCCRVGTTSWTAWSRRAGSAESARAPA